LTDSGGAPAVAAPLNACDHPAAHAKRRFAPQHGRHPAADHPAAFGIQHLALLVEADLVPTDQ